MNLKLARTIVLVAVVCSWGCGAKDGDVGSRDESRAGLGGGCTGACTPGATCTIDPPAGSRVPSIACTCSDEGAWCCDDQACLDGAGGAGGASTDVGGGSDEDDVGGASGGGAAGGGGAPGGGAGAPGGDGGSCIGVGEGCGDNGPACCKGTCQIEGCTNSIPGSCFGTCPIDSATSWNPTCGDPSCGPPTMGTCTTQVAGATCDAPGSACETGECGVALVCTTEAEAPNLNFCPRSRARFKRDINYVSEVERTALARELLRVPLAKYAYRDDPQGRTHLGFIMEDVEPSPMADSARNRVDLYGYLSMAVAALQSQQAELEALRGEVEQLQHANVTTLVCEP